MFTVMTRVVPLIVIKTEYQLSNIEMKKLTEGAPSIIQLTFIKR